MTDKAKYWLAIKGRSDGSEAVCAGDDISREGTRQPDEEQPCCELHPGDDVGQGGIEQPGEVPVRGRQAGEEGLH